MNLATSLLVIFLKLITLSHNFFYPAHYFEKLFFFKITISFPFIFFILHYSANYSLVIAYEKYSFIFKLCRLYIKNLSIQFHFTQFSENWIFRELISFGITLLLHILSFYIYCL